MLKLENIKKTFNPGTVNEKCALQGLSLHLKPGDFATIIGSNGAGKSTMMMPLQVYSMWMKVLSLWMDRTSRLSRNIREAGVIGRLFQDPLRGNGSPYDD